MTRANSSTERVHQSTKSRQFKDIMVVLIKSAPSQFLDLLSPLSSTNLRPIRYMERHSSLASKGLAVSVEQVSMFLTADGTVISFFEHSADDVEYVVSPRNPSIY